MFALDTARVLRVAGIPPSARLLQSPAFPQGEADGSALQVIRMWQGKVPGEPGGQVLVSGRVLSSFILAPAAINDPLPAGNVNENSEQQSAAIPVKLRVERSGFPGWTIIDSDRSLAVPAGCTITIDALMPATWMEVPGTIPIAEQAFYQYVTLWLTACPLRCCPARTAQLSWFGVFADNDVLVRPRGARALQIWGPTTGGSQWLLLNGDPAIATFATLGLLQINGGFVNADARIGAASHLQLQGGGGAGPIMWVWDVE